MRLAAQGERENTLSRLRIFYMDWPRSGLPPGLKITDGPKCKRVNVERYNIGMPE